MSAFGLPTQSPRPVRIERHQTAAWGWRWHCRRCGKGQTRLPSWDGAVQAATTHECDLPSAPGSPVLASAALQWTKAANMYRGWL